LNNKEQADYTMKKTAKIKTWFISKKLKQKIRYLFAFIIVAYFLIFALIYEFVIKDSLQENIRKSNYNTLISIGNGLTGEFQNIGTMGRLIMSSQEVIDYLKSDQGADSVSAYNAVTSIYYTATSFDNISSIYVFKDNGEYIKISNGITTVYKGVMEDPDWYGPVEEKAGANLVMVDGNGAFSQASGESVLSFVRVFNDIQTQKPIGKLVINCSLNMLRDTYREMAGDGKKFAYFHEKDQLLCGDAEFEEMELNVADSGDNPRNMRSGAGSFTYYYAIPGTPLAVAEHEQIRYTEYISTQILVIAMLIVLVTAASFFTISWFINRFITRPVESLVGSMEEVKSGWLKRVSMKLPDDEIGRLKNSYNDMLVEINSLIEELLEKEKTMQKAELEALQEQIKPHFLYNTLDTIAYLALENPREEVYDSIETLGNFYRKFLSKGSKEISLRDEVEIVRDYLKLQKLRYEDIFEDEYDIQESLLDMKIPKLILQPLVENSLYHGIRPKGEKCLIRISAYEKDDEIFIKVYDTGIGMAQSRIDAFMKGDSKSYGLRKTIERIRCYYGREDVYEIRSQEGYYCEVTIKIPSGGEVETYVQSYDHR